jgi:hypothetical protein
VTYSSFPQQGFGSGLNLVAKPDAVSQEECIDCLDVTFGERGAIEQRAGFDNLTGSALTNRVGSLESYYTTSGTKQLLAGCGTRLEAVNTSGTVIASATGLTSAVWDFARFGQPNAEVAYAGNGTDTLRKWSGTEWSAPKAKVDGEAEKAMPKGGALCVSPDDNRLMVAGFTTTTGGPNGTTSSPAHVYESEAGNPEEYESTAYEQLAPGDGEKIMAMVPWKEFVFVFKETKFFVRTRPTTDSEGKPIFNYRAVEGGAGLASARAVCAHPSGVYFMSRNGVYRTTGQEPELISSLIEPIWSGDASAFYGGGVLAHSSITNCAMTAHEDRIYLSFPTSEANNRTLVYDPQFEWWSLFSLPCSSLASFRISSKAELVFGYASGSNHIGRHSSSYTNDDGTAITSRWRSGWFDLENPDVKTIRASKVWGTGEVLMGLGHDFRQDAGSPEPLDFTDPTNPVWESGKWESETWAEPQALGQVQRRVAARGTTFSTYFANQVKDRNWSVHRVDHLLREVTKPSRERA